MQELRAFGDKTEKRERGRGRERKKIMKYELLLW